MKRLLLALLFPFAAFGQTTYTAASCSQTDVQAAINNEIAHAVDGDVITIPAGTCFYTGSVDAVTATFTNSVTIQGAGAISATANGASLTGTDNTVIINHTTNNRGVMNFKTTAGKTFRITGIAFTEDSGTPGPSFVENLNINGNSKSVRVDHCHFLIFVNGSKGLGFSGQVTGVADHLYVNTTQTIDNGIVFENGGGWQGDTTFYGNQSWADVDHFGSNQFMFVEDTQFSGGYPSDCSRGGRYVFRHSNFVLIQNTIEHGTHDQFRGCRASEAYLNTYSNASGFGDGGIVDTNGGTHVIWGNTGTDFRASIKLSYYRITGATFLSPVPPNGFGMCGNVTNGPSVWDQNLGSNGYACLDLPGRGAGDLLTPFVSSFADVLNSTTNTRTWPHQALIPTYVWNNSLSGAAASGYIQQSVSVLTDNLDYFQQFGTLGEPGTFNGTAGIGTGASLPTVAQPTCTPSTGVIASGTTWFTNVNPGGITVTGNWGPGYWDTTNNTLYVCTATNTWTPYYSPFTYPHPLTTTGNPTGTLSPTSLTFGNQGVGTTSAAKSFTFTNNGPGTLTISTITVTGDFAQTNNCPFSPPLGIGLSCTFNVTFTPTATGTRLGNVTITSSNATNSPFVENLTGTGIPPTLNGVVIKGVQISGGVQVTQ